ncbi:MAG: hypothetical protein VX990_03515 [Pseudomonadota bacterium]|nr:hypothetical protein [Pseudomonadota bacterium]
MAIIFSVLGLVLALVAMWLATEAIKRIEGTGTELVKPFVRRLETTLTETRTVLAKAEKRIADLERQVHILKFERHAQAQTPEDSATNRRRIGEAQNFTPTSVYNA